MYLKIIKRSEWKTSSQGFGFCSKYRKLKRALLPCLQIKQINCKFMTLESIRQLRSQGNKLAQNLRTRHLKKKIRQALAYPRQMHLDTSNKYQWNLLRELKEQRQGPL